MSGRNFKVLVVAHVKNGKFSPFVIEQAEALKKAGCQIDMFGVEGKGVFGYLKNYPRLKKTLKATKPDIVHAYYGLTGLLANFQRKYPVVTSFLGSDIHKGGWVFRLSKKCMKLSKYNIFGGVWLKEKSGYKKSNACIVRFGVDEHTFFPIDKQQTLERVKKDPHLCERLECFLSGKVKHPILFAGAFANAVKNAPLAQAGVDLLKAEDTYELIELKGYTREQVNLLQNFVDCLVVTSLREGGGPLVVKEAMASGCPVVSVAVGDVKEFISTLDGCYIVERTPEAVADGIRKAIAFGKKTDGTARLNELELFNNIIAGKIMDVYSKVLE